MSILKMHPTLRVLSLLHYPAGRKAIQAEREHLQEGERKVRRLIREISRESGPGTLLIEGNGREIHSENEDDPHSAAIREARRLGWRVVGLDQEKRLGYFRETKKSSVRQRYVMFDVRESEWVEHMGQSPPRGVSLAVMHPNHTAGFIQKGAVPLDRVRWIHAAPSPFSVQRLTPEELEAFLKAERARIRKG